MSHLSALGEGRGLSAAGAFAHSAVPASNILTGNCVAAHRKTPDLPAFDPGDPRQVRRCAAV